MSFLGPQTFLNFRTDLYICSLRDEVCLIHPSSESPVMKNAWLTQDRVSQVLMKVRDKTGKKKKREINLVYRCRQDIFFTFLNKNHEHVHPFMYVKLRTSIATGHSTPQCTLCPTFLWIHPWGAPAVKQLRKRPL